MILMYLSTYRSRSSQSSEEYVNSMKSFKNPIEEEKNHEKHVNNIANGYQRLQRNYVIDKKQLA